MKTRRFDFNWTPLRLYVSMGAEGSVPARQSYNSDTGEYTPDYTLTPLVIQPVVEIIDSDFGTLTGRANADLANIRWYENTGEGQEIISTSDTRYSITQSGSDAGQIQVRRNVEPDIPLTLVFYAEYVDTRSGQIYVIQRSCLVTTSSDSEQVTVSLDAAAQGLYNPLSDTRERTVTATVRIGSRTLDPSKYSLVWEVLGDDGWWYEAESDDVMDYDITVDGDSAAIDRWLMGEQMSLRVRVRYSPDGDPSSVTLDDSSPWAMAVFTRRIPYYDYDIHGVPCDIPPGILSIAPEAVITDTGGVITGNAVSELLPLWYIATNRAAGSLSWSLAAHGTNPSIGTSPLDNTYGAVLGLEVADRGYLGAWTDDDGSVLVDDTGAVLMIH